MRIVPSFLNAALDLLLPSRCVGCGTSGSYLCAECLATAEPATTLPLRPSALLAGLVVPFAYAGAPRNAVRRLKYSGLRAIAPSMAEPMAEALAAAVQSPFVLMPVPLHRKRLRQRGYNQTELLAREVSRNLGVPLRVDVLTRKRDTPPQVSTRSHAERMLNDAGPSSAFSKMRGEGSWLRCWRSLRARAAGPRRRDGRASRRATARCWRQRQAVGPQRSVRRARPLRPGRAPSSSAWRTPLPDAVRWSRRHVHRSPA